MEYHGKVPSRMVFALYFSRIMLTSPFRFLAIAAAIAREFSVLQQTFVATFWDDVLRS